MCVGNEMNGDDGVGPFVAKNFPKSRRFRAVNCGTVPENFLHLAENAEKVIIVDAVEMDLNAGEIRIVSPDSIKGFHFSTHSLPLYLLINYIKKFTDDVIIIGIQPKKMYGEMSEEAKDSGRRLIDIIINDRLDSLEKIR